MTDGIPREFLDERFGPVAEVARERRRRPPPLEVARRRRVLADGLNR